MIKDQLYILHAFAICIGLVALLSSTTNVYANPTLVVDVNNGAIAIHVGDTGPLPKTVWGQSGGDGSTTLTSGDWLTSNFEIFSAGDGFNGDGDSTPDLIPGWTVAVNSTQGYSELTFSPAVNIPEGYVFPLDITYNTLLDPRDILFTSVMGLTTLNWNTLYLGEAATVPEPTSMVLGTVGLALLGVLRRR